MSLTKRQMDVLLFIIRVQRGKGYCPSYREIAEGLELSTPSTIHRAVHALAERGYVKILKGRSRCIDVIREPGLADLVFTPDEVMDLNIRQNGGAFHPFTCPNRGDGRHHSFNGDQGALVATVRGWICPWCDYTQKWAHDFMKGG